MQFAPERNISPISRFVLGMRVDHATYGGVSDKIVALSKNGDHGYVCVGTVQMVMEAYDDPLFRQVVNSADIVTPDGMPLVWTLTLLGVKNAERVYGPTLLPIVCQKAQDHGIPVGFYGGTNEALNLMLQSIRTQFPLLNIAYAFSPPFRTLTDDEDDEIVKDIVSSRAKILFVGIGCPKQERWMAEHKDKIPAVMVGVGAAFDFIAGTKPQSPRWIQRIGLEWLFRLMTEPRRLWKRYLYHNPRFVIKFAGQLLGIRKYRQME